MRTTKWVRHCWRVLLKDLVKTIRIEPNTVIESNITYKFGHGYKKEELRHVIRKREKNMVKSILITFVVIPLINSLKTSSGYLFQLLL